MGRVLLVLFLLINAWAVQCQNTFSGKVLNAKDKKTPVEFATISTPDNNFWAITNANGEFQMSLPSGEIVLIISCIGYEKTIINVSITNAPVSGKVYYVNENNLSLDEVIVTAKKKDDAATSYTIERNALTHAQMKDIGDLMSQLPGGKTSYSTTLATTTPQNIVLRSESSSEMDNPALGTAIEIDGVRLSANANFRSSATDGIEGVDIRNIAVNNIESVEVVTGLPSVENGDLTSGLMKINTRKGKSPYEVEVVTKPETKSYSVIKGFDLGKSRGVLNTSLEYTKSISNRVSPYTTYTRQNLSLTYRNTFGDKRKPIEFTYGLTGNLGGYDSEADPDLFVGTYLKQKDYVARTNMAVKWFLNLPWITGIDLSTSVNYADRKSEQNSNENQSASSASIHAMDEGYNITQNYDENPDAAIITIPAGSWYELRYDDDKPVTYSVKLKANWVHKSGEVVNNVKLGGEFSYSGNYGRGIYYDDMRYAPTWREYRYDEQPFVKTYSFYAEDKIVLPLFGKQLDVQAGIRSDITSIKGSDYGVVNGWSPRLNAQYQLFHDNSAFLKNANVHFGWGDAIKLPSANILYPRPSYVDRLAFTSTSDAVGTAFYAYYTIPLTTLYNTDLKWQRRRKMEVGVDFELGKTNVSLTAYRDKTFNPYMDVDVYNPVSYKFMNQTVLEEVQIPEDDRIYSIDNTTGVVTVSDKTGTYSDETLRYAVRNLLRQNSYYGNGSSVLRKGVEWIVDFGKIDVLKTSIRLDGSYYYYKGINQTIQEGSSSLNMADGSPYQYVGLYIGSATSSNGSEHKKINSNVTFTTHIPAIRMIVSCRLESSLYDYSLDLSEYSEGRRSYVLDDVDSYVPSSYDESIYGVNNYVITYPIYYKSFDDINNKIPFLERFLWAKENDRELYNELAKLIKKTSRDYSFKARKYSPCFSANINVTKEIGDRISITFKATNFYNNTGRITDSQTGNEASLYGNSKIASFYYGMSMRLKL